MCEMFKVAEAFVLITTTLNQLAKTILHIKIARTQKYIYPLGQRTWQHPLRVKTLRIFQYCSALKQLRCNLISCEDKQLGMRAHAVLKGVDFEPFGRK